MQFARIISSIRRQAALVLVAAIAVAALLADTASARARLARLLTLDGSPEPASASVLSEHETDALDGMPPQAQAELLLERSIDHYAGANEQIAARVHRWRGQLALDGRLDDLFRTAINSDDLRVRAAALEVDIVGRHLDKSVETVDRLEPLARSGEQGPRANALWDLGLLGNRGVEPERIAEILTGSLHDENVNVRYWAVEGLAYLGTDEAIAPLLEVLHDDPSPLIRERAACGLAQSGMLAREQRYQAVPKLIEFAGDFSLDGETRGWVFQALRDITGQSLPREQAAWQRWYASER